MGQRNVSERRTERIALTAEVALRRSGKLNFRVRVFDISRLGCRLEFIERPSLEELVWLRFDALEAIEAQVCWVDGFTAGVAFNAPIHPAVFEQLLARLRSYARVSGRA